MNIVGMGGGTGLPVLLRGLKELNDSGEEAIDITAVVTVADNGGSTGLVRQAFGMPAMGDIRNSIIALATCKSILASVCQHRFQAENVFTGHSVGNLMFASLHEMSQSFTKTVQMACELFEVDGRVLPCTGTQVHLCALYNDGFISEGESSIPRTASKIDRVWLTPSAPPAAIGVLQSLMEADAIVLGPGSLYTSIIPNLLVDDVAEAVAESHAVKIYVCNLMTQRGETGGYSAADHLRVLQSYLPPNAIDVCVLNTGFVGNAVAEKYFSSGSNRIGFGPDIEQEIRKTGVIPAPAPLLKSGEAKIRHDAVALARLIVSLARGVIGSHDRAMRRREREVTCAESSDISVPEKSRVYS